MRHQPGDSQTREEGEKEVLQLSVGKMKIDAIRIRIVNKASIKHQRVYFYDDMNFDFFFGFFDLNPVWALDYR